MKKNQKIRKEIEKKKKKKDKILKNYDFSSHLLPKKPLEIGFKKEIVDSYEFPIAIGNTIFEIKRDGYGVDIIINEKIRLFSLDGNEWNINCFPEIIDDLKKLPNGYYRGEVFGLNSNNKSRFTSIDEFSAIQKRPKQNSQKLTQELLDNYPLRIELFDIIYFNNKPLCGIQLSERRKILESLVKESKHFGLVMQWSITDKLVVYELFQEIATDGYEGLIAKDPSSYYEPGSRDNNWLKLKNFTTVDLAIIGIYKTDSSNKNGKPISGVLVGSFNEETGKFETLAKIKIGKKEISEKIYSQIFNSLAATDINCLVENKNISFNPEIKKQKQKIPFQIIDFSKNHKLIIIEIQVLNITFTKNWHSCGIDKNGFAHSLRIPTFVRIRDDKTKKEEVTSTKQIQKICFG